MLLSSIAIPFVAHTCNKTAHTDVSFMTKKAFCHHSEENTCHNNEREAVDKEACCFSLEGVIDSDTELVFSQINYFDGAAALIKFDILPKVIIFSNQNSQKYFPIAVDKMKQIPLQITQQSFLC